MKPFRDPSLPLILLLAVLAALGVTFAYRDLGHASAEAESLVAVFKTLEPGNEFWAAVKEGVESAAADFGFRASVTAPEKEVLVDDQVALTRAAIAERPAALVLAAGDVDRLVEPVREARQAGVKVVLVDSFISTEDADAKIGTDNVEAGRRCGEALLRLLPEGSTVAVMSYVKGSSTAIDRERGLREAAGSRLALSQSLYSGSELEVAYRQALGLLKSAHPPAGIAALNQPTATGAARALAESGLQDRVVLVGFDSSREILGYIEKGVIRDSIVQNPFNMGYLAVKTARELVDGKKAPRYVNTGSLDIDRASLFEPANQRLLFPVEAHP